MRESKKEHATGYAPTALPFYEELDAAAFEKFCTDLLNLRPVILCLRSGQVEERRIVCAKKLGSGTPQRGADIRADADQGEVWYFQCKRVKHLDAPEVTATIELLEQGFPHADQYVLVTTCGLSAESQNHINARSKWMWWDSSRLTTETRALGRAENGISLVNNYFGKDWVKRLFVWGDQPYLTWQEFFAEEISQERQHFHHRTEFLQRGEINDRLEGFARDGAGRALILSGSGGQGKSRLLLEFARRVEQKSEALRVRFLNLSGRGLSEEHADFLAREKDLVLVVDDAHRLDAALGDLARAASKAKSLRLLVATRLHSLEAVKSQLFGHGYAERLEEPLHLSAWNLEDMVAIAERVLDSPYRLDAARLARLADRCPLLVVLGGAIINAGGLPEAVTDEQDFRERVFKGFKEDFLRLQTTGKRDRLDRAIQFLSFVSPAPKTDQLLNKAAEILGCSAFEVAEDLKLLQAARLLVENREGVRLYPDLFADAVLLDACLDHAGKPSFLHDQVLTKLAINDFPALMRNVAQADWEARVQKAVSCSLFDPVWKEFVRRFEDGVWVPSLDSSSDFRRLILERYGEGKPKVPPPDRSELLRQWGSFAIYLPERTLELAELALRRAEPSASPQGTTPEVQTNARASVCAALPSLLKPLVIWHPQYAGRALDILWSLDADEPSGNWSHNSNAIAAIAEAASFEVHKPFEASETVISWIEAKVQEPAALDRLRRQPWVLSALLKPFFGREVEHTWATGRTLHVSASMLSAEKTRPLRQRALSMAERFISAGERDMVSALLPVIREAIHSIFLKFGGKPTPEMQGDWLPDRLEALKVLERALEAHRNSPFILLQLRPILRNRCEYDPDPIVRKECRRVLSGMPESFEFRVARVLTYWVHDEISPDSGSSSELERKPAEDQWTAFCRGVARDVVERFKTAKELCGFVRGQVREVAATGTTELGGALLDLVAEISPDWCASLLEELLAAEDTALDGFLWPVIRRAETAAPEAYRGAVESLPISGRPAQLSTLISSIGRKHFGGEILNQFEWQAILDSTRRTEEAVIISLASVAGNYFSNQPKWAIEILCQLKPAGERDADAILRALGQLAEKHAANLSTDDIAQCLANVGERCFPESTSDDRDLEKIAEWFPKQVYEHVRHLHERAEADPANRHPRQFAETLSLGPINDPEYVDREIDALWRKAVSAEAGSFSQRYRLALIRSLLWSEAATAPDRLRKLVAECKSGDELRLATELAAAQGSRFVFKFPDIVRALLTRGEELAVAQAVRETLWLSACGGARSFTNNDLNPEYRYILEQGEALANRYRDDAILAGFYRLIANSERRDLEWHRQLFLEEADLE